MRIRVFVSMVAVLLGLAGPLKSQNQGADLNPLNQLAWMMGANGQPTVTRARTENPFTSSRN